jgi:hypothetical protein
MTAPSGKLLPVGLRHVQLFELNAAGLPNATATTPYEGLEIVGPKTYELNLPDARTIAHEGGDGVLDTDTLPPKEAPTGTLRAARNDYDVYAAITGTKVRTLGEAKLIGIATSKQGYEPEFGMLLYQQAKSETGGRVWRGHILPKTRLIVKPSGMVESPAEHTFQVLPSKVTKAIWGTAFTLDDDGFTRSFYHELNTQYQPWLVAWKGDNVATDFLFHADRPAVATTKISGVWIDGVIDATVTKAVDKITPTTKPGAGSIIVALIEIANPMEG